MACCYTNCCITLQCAVSVFVTAEFARRLYWSRNLESNICPGRDLTPKPRDWQSITLTTSPLAFCIVLYVSNSIVLTAWAFQKCSRPQQFTLCWSLHAKAPQATVSEGLAHGSYVAARVGFEPTTLPLKGFDSTNAPQCPAWQSCLSSKVLSKTDPACALQLAGMTEVEVRSLEETMKLLEEGSQGRTTGSTAMNNSSSRSHAIFTIYLDRKNKKDRQVSSVWMWSFL